MSKDPSAASQRLDSLSRSISLIDRSILGEERDLTTTKWFGYRFMPPLESTMHFAALYRTAYQSYIRVHVDLNLAPRTRGVSLAIPSRPERDFTQLWKARQRADSHCLPYDEYLAFCFDFAARRTRNAPPRPNQLHGSDTTGVAWDYEFEKFLDGRLAHVLSKNPLPHQYRLEAFSHLPAQIDVRELLFAHLRHTATPLDRAIGRWNMAERILPVLRFRAGTDVELFKQVISRLKDDRGTPDLQPAPLVPATREDLWQSCFGVANARDLGKSPCTICPQSRDCRKMAELAERVVVATLGTSDPVRDQRRAQGAVRAARFREKKRLSALSVGVVSSGAAIT